jgi:hypothetical protein
MGTEQHLMKEKENTKNKSYILKDIQVYVLLLEKETCYNVGNPITT